MELILNRNRFLGRPAQTLAVGLVLLAMVLLAACSGKDDAQPTEETQPAATSAAASAATSAATSATAPAAAETAQSSRPLVQVVTTTNFVADWARAVGGDRVEVFGLLPVGGDPHSFQPGARDVTKVADADLVLTVGLQLEAQWLEDLVHNAAADESKVVALGDSVDPIEFAMAGMHDEHEEGEHGHEEDEDEHEEDGHGHEADEDEHEEDEHGHDHGAYDPHFWFEPVRVKAAVNVIAAQLSAVDPDSASYYYKNAAAYGEQLDELHAWIQEQVDTVAPERRLLVTSHDAFAYFARAYGFEIVGLVIPSLAPDVEPSAEHLAGLVEVVRERNVPALFGETTVSERLAQAVARETGAELVQLYSGSLGPEGSGADTYIGMLRANVERIVEALR